MDKYTVNKLGKRWAVYNKETGRNHSIWSNSHDAYTTAIDLNNYLKKVNNWAKSLNKGR